MAVEGQPKLRVMVPLKGLCGSNWAPLGGALRGLVGHTVLAILEARQVLETSPIERSKGLAGDGGHGGEA